MNRREWLALISATPLLHAAPDAPTSPVAISQCPTYDEDITAKLSIMFDQLGGIDKLVRNKTVTIKLNMTGAPSSKLQGMALGRTHYNHPKVVGAVAYLLGKAGAKRIRFTESPWAWAGPLEDVMLDAGWNVRSLVAAAPGVEFENTNAIGTYKQYARCKFPGPPYMYPEPVLNPAYEQPE